MDDTWAIAYVLSRSDVFDTRLIVTATMNTTGRACIVAKVSWFNRYPTFSPSLITRAPVFGRSESN